MFVLCHNKLYRYIIGCKDQFLGDQEGLNITTANDESYEYTQTIYMYVCDTYTNVKNIIILLI